MSLINKIRFLLRANVTRRFRDPTFVSVYADASFYEKRCYTGKIRNGGWGMWGRDEKNRLFASGPCPDWVHDCNMAELCAVSASIHLCVEHLDAESSDILVVKTDSQTVCQWFGWSGGVLRHGRLPEQPEACMLIYRALECARKADVKLVVKWVKGHRGNVDVSGYLNERADKMARTACSTKKHSLWIAPIGKNGEPPTVYTWDERWLPWEKI
jgi:ribonuclease HI